jgi:predicted transcriptional regulator
MASATTGRVALFSIKPQYADAILAGSKEVEFRRTSLAEDVSHVVIYATAPIKKIVGTFEVEGVERSVPDALWKTYSQVGGIAHDAYADYFEGADTAYAIKVRSPRQLPQPLALTDLSPGLRAPQSYQYLRDDALAKVTPFLGSAARQSLLTRLASAVGGLLRR